MTPEMVQAWIPVVEALVSAGVDVVMSLGGIIHLAHPALTPDEVTAMQSAILADDRIRAAFAAAAAGGN